jgi:hypothetical protein
MHSHLYEDGSRSFLVDVIDKSDALTALAKFNIEVLATEDAIFDGHGKVLDVDFLVRCTNNDLSFAMDSITKMIRPYPKDYVFKKRE